MLSQVSGAVFLRQVKTYKKAADDLYRMSKIVKRDCNRLWGMVSCNQRACSLYGIKTTYGAFCILPRWQFTHFRSYWLLSIFFILCRIEEMGTLKKTEYLTQLAGLFRFKTITDDRGNEFVLFADSSVDRVEHVQDKTAFDAETLGQVLLNSLKFRYPQKQFVVYVSLCLHDSMIIRFHQKWGKRSSLL